MTTIGDNLKNASIKERLEAQYPEIFARLRDLENAALIVPERLASDDDAGKAQDLVKMMRVAIKQADATRDAEKEPHAQAVKEVNAAFKIPMERLEVIQKKIMSRLDAYLEEKKEAERQAREAEAKRQREEVERLAREAEEAEKKRLAAEAARKAEEERARAAEAAKLRAIQEAREAEERAAAAKAEAARLETERKAREAAAAKAAAEKAERDAAEETERQARAEADRVRLAELKAQREAEEQRAREAREAAAAARADQQQAEAAAKAAKAEQAEAARHETAALGQAVRAEKRADRLDGAASASDADLSRTRGELGTVGSLARRWVFRVTNYDAIPMDVLRPFLAREAIDAAIHKLMMTGRRELAGVEFEQISEARVA